MNKIGKTELYRQRCQDKQHQVRMHVSGDILTRLYSTKDAYETLRTVCREFNAITEEWTRTNQYTVPLNLPLVQMAADFYYQYRQFKKWAENNGHLVEFNTELPNEIHQLFKATVPAAPTGTIVLETEVLLKKLPQANKGNAVAVFLYMKARCSKPNQPGGVTDLKVETIAEDLGLNRTTVTRARKLLEEQGLVELIYKSKVPQEGRIVTLARYRIMI